MGGTKPQFKPIDNPAAFAENTFTKVFLIAHTETGKTEEI